MNYQSAWEKRYGALALIAAVLILALGTFGLTKNEYDRYKADEMAKIASVLKVTERNVDQELEQARSMTADLQLITVQKNGRVSNFKAVARQMIAWQKYAASLCLLPKKGDSEQYFYPKSSRRTAKAMKEASGQQARRHAARYNETAIQGPVDLADGSRVFIFYRPIFLKRNGHKQLWGYAACGVKVSEILKITIANLRLTKVNYRLSKTLAPGSQQAGTVFASKQRPESPKGASFKTGHWGSRWFLELAPATGWKYGKKTKVFLAYALFVDLLLLILTAIVIRRLGILLDLRQAARYDALTQIYNRRGFEAALKRARQAQPDRPFVLAILDIDDFKLFNDYYGHQTGDAVLKQVARSLKEAAGPSGLVCRSGGDEFLLALIGQDAAEAEDTFKKVMNAPHELDHNGHHITYSLSLGYADYPDQGESLKTLSQHADEALYDVKLNGKKGMQRYSGHGQQVLRSQLAFNLHDVVAHMPSALLIIQPEPQGKILFANQQTLKLLGYDDLWSFHDANAKRDSHLVAPEDLKRVQAWTKDFAQEENLGQVRQLRYHVLTRDGKHVLVMADFSLVKNNLYGLLIYQTMSVID